MKIQKVRISNYRSIKDTIEIDFSQVTALIGPNNSGKSNILWCINKILGQENSLPDIFTEKDVYQQDPERDIDAEIEFDQPFEHIPFEGGEPSYIHKIRLIYKHNESGPGKGKRTLNKYCLTKDDRIVQVLSENNGMGSSHLFTELECPLEKIREKIPVVYIRTDRITTHSRSDIRKILLNGLLKDINRDFMREDNTITIMNSDGTETQIPRKVWFEQCIQEAMITLRTGAFSNLKQTIRESMLDYLGHPKDKEDNRWEIYFNPVIQQNFYQSLDMCLYEGDRLAPVKALGEGVQNAIVLSILNAYNQQKSEGFIFMIEEPELYLDPRMKRNLYKALYNMGKKNQVIYITHSPQFVSLQDFDSVRIVTNDGNGTRVKAPLCHNVPQLKEHLGSMISGSDLNEMFFTGKILLVENDRQKKILMDHEAQMGLDFDSLDVAILVVGDKSNIPSIVDLAKAFDIRVGIAFEEHSVCWSDKRDEEDALNEKLLALAQHEVSIFCHRSGSVTEQDRSLEERVVQWITKT
ncbi:MAG TPA: AAA family ATPase [Bacteroidales bacterium]|nr:MAG: Chromosome partition protein Smc [Bacteroidetes bacterium ADurb.Bin139]HOG25998.1 AAA family ATPase [Bacteroidales bacterium]HPK38794.1 AAA family ATPase [Bacteroidales bacterium]HQN81579.1 AAA family ATPase [Bacteroidales bacterium]HQP63884.1 AAA family ATPase [Bacteroidales bacterium]